MQGVFLEIVFNSVILLYKLGFCIPQHLYNSEFLLCLHFF